MADRPCPKAEDIGELRSDIKSLRHEVERLRDIVILNAESRVHAAGIKEGEHIGRSKILATINIITYVLGAFLLLVILSAVSIAVAGVDTVSSFLSTIFKFIKLG